MMRVDCLVWAWSSFYTLPLCMFFFFNRDSKDSHYIKKRYIAMEDVSKISGEFPCTSESILTMWEKTDCSKLDFHTFLLTAILTNWLRSTITWNYMDYWSRVTYWVSFPTAEERVPCSSVSTGSGGCPPESSSLGIGWKELTESRLFEALHRESRCWGITKLLNC